MAEPTHTLAASSPTLPGFEILGEQRRDTLGIVYRARQVLYNQEVSLRLVDERARGGRRDITPFCRAAQEATHYALPPLLPLIDVGEDEGQFYIASAPPPGPSLRQRLDLSPLEPAEAARTVAAVARVVGRLHEHRVLHLGLTSACVFLAPDGAPHVGDVGLSELLHHHLPFPGDPTRSAPEQIAGQRADARADVYALGVLLHECLTGRPPQPHAQFGSCPPALAHIGHKALSARPERRYASAALLADDLERFARGEAPPPGLLTRGWEWAQRNPAVAGLSVALALLLIAFTLTCTSLALQLARTHTELSQQRDHSQQVLAAAEQMREATDQAAQLNAQDVSKVKGKLQIAERNLTRTSKTLQDESRLRRQLEKKHKEERERRLAAEETAKDAEEARKAAVDVRNDATRRLVRLYAGHGASLVENGDLAGALVPLTRALALARREKLPDDDHRLRLATVLALCPRPLSVLSYKKGDVQNTQLSPDGKRLFTVGADGIIEVRDAAGGTLIGKRLVHGAAVAHAVFGPDGKRVLSVSSKGELRVWNVDEGKEEFDVLTLPAVPVHLSFSGDGSRFVAVQPSEMDETATEAVVRDAGTGETMGDALTSQVARHGADLNYDGTRVVLCCTDRAARIYHVANGRQVGPALNHGGEVTRVAFSGDGRLVLTAGDGSARVWEAATGKALLTPLEHTSATIAAHLDASGRLVLTAGRDGTVMVHDATTGRPAGPALRTASAASQALLSPDGRYALLAGGNIARVFDVRTGRDALARLVNDQPVAGIGLALDSSRALTFDGGSLRVWDLTAGEPLAPPGPPAEAGAVYSADGKRVARMQGSSVQVYDRTSGKALGAAMKHKGEVRTVVFSPGGDHLLTVANPPEPAPATPTWDVRVWEAGTGKPITDAMEHLREVKLAAFSADGAWVLTVALDKRARLFDAKTGKLVGKALDHPVDVTLLVLSPDGKHLITSDEEGMTRAWDAATGDRVGEGMGHAKPVTFVAFSNGGKLLATCCEDGKVRIWELASGKQQIEVEHAAAARHATFSPDDKLLLTGSGDSTARLWGVEDGKPRTPPLRHPEAVQRTAFSETGRWLLTGAGRFVRLWDARTGEPLGPPLPHARRDVRLTGLAYSRTGELMSEAGPGTRWLRPLREESRPDSDLADLARVLSGREETAPGQVAPVAARDLEAAFERLSNRHAAELAPPKERLLAWARRGAEECEARGLSAGALRHLDVLLAGSSDPVLLARRGKARLQLGMVELALEDFDKAVKEGAKHWDWWAGRAEAAARLGKWEQAAEDWTKATQLEGRRPELWRGLGQAEAERGEWKKAEEALARAVRFGATDPMVWYEHALAQLSAGDEKGYRRSCERLVKKFGGRADPAVRRVVAEACTVGPDALPDFKALLARAEKAVLEAPSDVEERVRLAALLLRAGQAVKAIELLEKVAAGDDVRPVDLSLLTLAYKKAGQADKAREWERKALKAKPREGAPWTERQAGALWRKEAEKGS